MTAYAPNDGGASVAEMALDIVGTHCRGCDACQSRAKAVASALLAALALCNEVNPTTGKPRNIVNAERLRPVLRGQPDPFPRPSPSGEQGTSAGSTPTSPTGR